MIGNNQHSSLITTPIILPEDASWHSTDGGEGWIYSLFDPYGERFVLFLWHDGVSHVVSLVDPPLEGEPDRDEMRITTDGRLKPMKDDEQDSLETAFLNSVMCISYRAIFDRQRNAESMCY